MAARCGRELYNVKYRLTHRVRDRARRHEATSQPVTEKFSMKRASTRCLSSALAFVVVAGLTISVPGPTPLRAQAQASEPLPRFEVASVKQNTSGAGRVQTITQPGGRFVGTNVPLKLLIADAFLGPTPLALTRILGGPEWIESARYDINAKASGEFQRTPGGPPREMLLMIRSLLEERFKLTAHRETRDMPIYELVVARADGTLGPELRRSAVDCDAIAAA